MAKEETIKTSIELTGEQAYRNACKEINGSLRELGSEMKLTSAEYANNATSTEALVKKQEILKKTLDEQSKKAEAAEAALKKMKDAGVSPTDAAYQKMQTNLNNVKAEMAKTRNEIDDTTDALKKSKNHWGEVGEAAKKAGEVLGASVAALGAAAAAAATALAGLTKSAIEGYADYEQLVGGVETLFGSSAEQVEAYADKAYQTAGMSANEYMETVTGFSASLLQSLDGDTEAAAKKADMAITDMSDNANKMGSDISSLQTAYAGFAKGQFTLLDNLKLGYGGTKTEMERLLADAEKISGVKYDISSYGDIVDAIHVVQTEMGITGTTAKEASTTISGSIGSMQAAWQNWITGMANSNADFSALTDSLVQSVSTVADNLLPIILNTIPNIVQGLSTIATSISAYIPTMAANIIPALMEGAKTILSTIVSVLPELMAVVETIIPQIVQTIGELLPMLIESGIAIITQLSESIAEDLPNLMPQIVEIMIQICETLIANIDKLVYAALQLMIGLATGIIQALPNIITRIPEIITAIVNALIGCIDQIILAGVQLLTALITNLPQIIAAVIQAAPQIVDALVDAFAQLYSKITDIGVNLLHGIWEGISSAASWLWDKVHEWANSFIEDVEDFFGIESPSKVFAGIGGYLALGLGEGFNDEMKDVEKSMLAETAKVIPDLSLTDSYKSGKGATIVNHNTFMMDGKPFYEAVNTHLGLMY